MASVSVVGTSKTATPDEHSLLYNSPIILISGLYKNDKKEGHWEYYHPNGKPQLKGNFKNDKRR